jgi:proline iminopeptidase
MSEGLYPALEPLTRDFLPVSGGHRILYEVCGAPVGTPALFLHGGPGSSFGAVHRRFFDPAFYRLVLFDQRGCGQSTPRGEIRDNTTGDLLDDIERLRLHLGVQRWMLFGGSWGSTLALAYAQRHPDRVGGLVLRGLFLASRDEVQWFLHGLRRVVPEAWSSLTDQAATDHLVAWYQAEVGSSDTARAIAAARRWVAYENAVMAVGEAAGGSASGPDDAGVLDRVKVQLHYLAHDCFLQPGALLAGMDRLRELPAILVQGRRDLVCPPVTAYTVSRDWPRAQLRVVEEGGHSALHPAMTRALVRAADDMRELLRARGI